MNNFRFYAPTDVRFGKGQISALAEVVKPWGSRVLLVYGGGSIKSTNLYEQVMQQLKDCTVVELSGVEPNPRIESVRKGVELCKEHSIDLVLAVGGGSVIDASKVIAGGARYHGDSWDIVMDPTKITDSLPVLSVLTLAATGSEMNGNAVISNDSTQEKIGTGSPLFIPKASICDPSLLFSLPPIQTAAGTVDIMSHVIEQYFQKENSALLSDRLAESILKTCITCCPIALDQPTDYDARANLMWSSTMALNGLVSAGKGGAWTCHPIEHELSAFYNVTHGVGLAIVTPHWMRYILNEDTVERFVLYAKNVWGLEDSGNPVDIASTAIDLTEDFFKRIGVPMTLTELGIDDTHFDRMAEDACKFGGLEYAYVPLHKEDVKNILKMCL